ncbi:cytochrome o ubiquinol oxidase subunit IV [Candidatus Saccharibacteria bacterium]|jgi:cytochrome o ubiquinol oxidase subunit IV|nr:cytochrome o ubiquinol oxidase subunit IV [Candidatus Saccharibacteria bacterium]
MSKPETRSAGHDHEVTHGSYISYVVGFVLSVALTLVAYFAVVNGWMTGWSVLLFVTALAIAQLLVQLLFFLHMSQEKRPRFNLMTFGYAVMVVVILVIGSLWIMYNMRYNMVHEMTPEEVEQFIIEDEGIKYLENDQTDEHSH